MNCIDWSSNVLHWHGKINIYPFSNPSNGWLAYLGLIAGSWPAFISPANINAHYAIWAYSAIQVCHNSHWVLSYHYHVDQICIGNMHPGTLYVVKYVTSIYVFFSTPQMNCYFYWHKAIVLANADISSIVSYISHPGEKFTKKLSWHPSESIWTHIWNKLLFLLAQIHCLGQCWYIIYNIIWGSPQGNYHDIHQWTYLRHIWNQRLSPKYSVITKSDCWSPHLMHCQVTSSLGIGKIVPCLNVTHLGVEKW